MGFINCVCTDVSQGHSRRVSASSGASYKLTVCADIPEGPITFLGGFPLLLEYDQTFCIEGKPLIMCKSCYTRYKKRWEDGALFLITEVRRRELLNTPGSLRYSTPPPLSQWKW